MRLKDKVVLITASTRGIGLACAKACITAIDLDGPMLCREDPVVGGSVFRAPWIDVSNDAGLGIHDVSGLIRIG